MRKIEDLPNSEAASTDYPYGRIKDETPSENGTPVIEATYSDCIQSLTRFMQKASETPNDLPDNVTNGFQVMRAIEKILKPVGTLRITAGATMGEDELHCNGAVYDPVLYPDLYAEIGTTYGGTAGAPLLPNYTEKVLRGGAMGGSGGADTVTLIESQIPSHTHGGVGGRSFLVGNTLQLCESYEGSPSTNDGYGIKYNGAPALQANTNSTGGGLSHNNIPAYLNVVVFIKAKYLGDAE